MVRIKVHRRRASGVSTSLRTLQARAVYTYTYIRGPIAGSTTEISVDGTHEEGNGNGNANARRPGSGKRPGKGTHPPASVEMFVNCAPSNTISSPNDGQRRTPTAYPGGSGDGIGDSLLNDVEPWNSHSDEQNAL